MMKMQEELLLNSVNIFKMKSKLYFIVLILCATSCRDNAKQSFYYLVNENFFMFVDTIAYKTGRLIQIPGDTFHNFNLNKISISIDTSFDNSVRINESVLAAVRTENLKDFEELILNDEGLKFNALNISLIKNTGKFDLVNSKNVMEVSGSAVNGEITFYKPYIAGNFAIIVLSISESSKAGYINCWLFRRENGIWGNIKKIEIERW